MTLLSKEDNPTTMNTGFSSMIDPYLLYIAMGSGLLGASGPSPYQHGTLGMGLSQGVQNYFNMLPNLEKFKQLQMQNQVVNSLIGALSKQPVQQQAVNPVGNQNVIPPAVSGMQGVDLGASSFGLPKVELRPPGIENPVDRWLWKNLKFNPTLGLNVPSANALDYLKKKDMVGSSDLTEYPMYAFNAVGTDAPPPTVSSTRPSLLPQPPPQTPVSQTGATQTKQVKETGGVKVEPLDLQQMVQELTQAQEGGEQQPQFPLSFEQMILLKAATGIDLFGAYEAWLKSITPTAVSEGNVLVTPQGKVLRHIPKDGMMVIYNKDGIPVGSYMVPGWNEAVAQSMHQQELAKQQAQASYRYLKVTLPNGKQIYMPEALYTNMFSKNIMGGQNIENFPFAAEPSSEQRIKEAVDLSRKTKREELAAKQFEDIQNAYETAMRKYPIVELLESRIKNLIEIGEKGGPSTHLRTELQNYVTDLFNTHRDDPLISKLLISDIGGVVGMLAKGAGPDSLSPGNLNQTEQKFWEKLGPSLTDPIQVMWAKVLMFKEAVDRQKVKAEMAQQWINDFGSLSESGMIYNPVTKKTEKLNWTQYWNKYIDYRANSWLNKVKQYNWGVK